MTANTRRGLKDMFKGSENVNLQDMINSIENGTTKEKLTVVQINLSEIRPNPYQPRKHFDEEKLYELAQSIRENGVFQPIIVKKAIQGYELIAGERRFRASKIADKETIPAIIVEFTDQQMMEIALLENIQREDLNAIEEAKAYQSIMEKLDITQEELSKKVGKSRAHIANTVRLLKMPQQLQDYILEGKLTMGHIKPLITLNNQKALLIAREAIRDNLTVREVEEEVKRIKKNEERKLKPKKEKSREIQYVEKLLRDKLSTKATLNNDTIMIKYSSIDELNRILEIMGILEDY